MTRSRNKLKRKRLRKNVTIKLYEENLPENSTEIFSDNNSFNDNLYLRESHNCYMYFLNKKNNEVVRMCQKDYHKHKLCRRAQPGYVSGHPMLGKHDYKCPKIMGRTLSDNPNIYEIGEFGKCAPTHYKGALVVAPNRDYHYYRENDDGQWSHKPGYKPSTNYDSKNNLILNPRKAMRDYGGTLNYKDFCGYLCVPRNDKRKQMAHWNKSQMQQGGKSMRKIKKKGKHDKKKTIRLKKNGLLKKTRIAKNR
tara:strand:+ start:57 stop:809 length:753 start_codon:yes stop_codon:yes gene_type:complete